MILGMDGLGLTGLDPKDLKTLQGCRHIYKSPGNALKINLMRVY